MTRNESFGELQVVDWRRLSADEMDRLYAAEIERWAAELEWETAADWGEVERGRRLGTVSGVAITNQDGTVVGWSYYLVHEGSLQVGGFTASSETAAQLMIDSIFTEAALTTVDAVTFFAFSSAPGLSRALRAKGLAVDRYWYLRRVLQRVETAGLSDVRGWHREDLVATADLLGRAYPPQEEARPFAPGGTPEQWRDYVSKLVDGAGCGTLLPSACLCIPNGPNRLIGVALVTKIAPTTAHLVQIAIDRPFQGGRVGARLLELACEAANEARCRDITLFVGARNRRARSLYELSRFEMVNSFVAAGSLQPRRLTSVAPGAVVMTRR
jgi:ribosomal protein S18 acetylase RimI-like enzyme